MVLISISNIHQDVEDIHRTSFSLPIEQIGKTEVTLQRGIYKRKGGAVEHGQNDANVVEYHLWTDQWTQMLQASKFSQEKWPLAFELLNNCGGENHEGYFGLQDHGDDVWYRNIRIKVME